ncbi:hypothetical protein A3C87_02840 [Candidatus Kaiserbacteria bacterium RIFCSPHIGHO2_02_FULL_49_34]|uniref:Uncharacterized protein n=1 Tax=Candidatus Kaiserbacteria bacterium RIFCSPHIGHO2_02_FULL_49_34 TaxID=1798491 RepID=A0A1F6DJF8_9BACT|nr:MAG: hypothetical protein A3C87_02840 [Candidatus Kaiserbacteria bacterium RIFCSPHIGHO2_02_FULL_49_34]
MFQDLADDNNLDDVMLDGDDFPVDDEELEVESSNSSPEDLLRDNDGNDPAGDEDDDENPLFDSFEDRDLL